MPKRIQRQRTKGYRLPPNAVYVGRPTKWGNPFRAGMYNVTLGREINSRADAVRVFRERLEAHSAFFAPGHFDHTTVAQIRDELRGKDLVCWCPLDQPCHADVLLEWANGGAAVQEGQE